MISKGMTAVLRDIRRVALLHDGAEATDGQLLRRFLDQQEEAAFEMLMQRHGPMVLGVCHRILCSAHDGEDAFQATFLVLVRKGESLRRQETIGNWLYGVAYHTALKARAMANKRRENEAKLKDRPLLNMRDAASEDLQAILDQEIASLPDKYRQVVVLCELEGQSRKEAASLLGIPEGTLSSRLATARQMLIKRFAKHGLGVSAVALAGVLSQAAASASILPSLALGTTKAAVMTATGTAVGASVVSAKVAALTDGVMKAMFLTKLKIAAALIVIVGAMGLGLGQVGTMGTISPKAAAQEPKSAKEATPAKDRDSLTIARVNNGDKIPLKGLYKKVEIVDINGNGEVDGVDFDADEIILGSINGNAKVILKGKTKRLQIGAINGSCLVDASGLLAATIEIGEINGSGKIKLQSAGNVRMSGPLNGVAEVGIKAQGDVRFAKTIEGAGAIELTTKGDLILDEQIRGALRVKVAHCKNFTVQGGVEGAAEVDATYEGTAVCVGKNGTQIRLTKAEQNRLGIRGEGPTDAVAAQLGLVEGKGLLLLDLREGSVAAKAGLKVNDILIELAGKEVPSAADEFAKLLTSLKAGMTVDAVIVRQGKSETIKGIVLP